MKHYKINEAAYILQTSFSKLSNWVRTFEESGYHFNKNGDNVLFSKNDINLLSDFKDNIDFCESYDKAFLKTKMNHKDLFEDDNVSVDLIIKPKIEIKSFLEKYDLEVIDTRKQVGALWVVGGEELEPLFGPLTYKGYVFVYTVSGDKATNGRPGWYLKQER